ncbi:SRPBCC domain-containing protein [Chitinophaga sp. Mgbs1]|uniref:SRPBCC domain-containing protein n=1 Tax=Chitinophaga solisilvae TaxID=1233460 RepID=A0A433WD44_9BACT|nr:SRPBCC domain-containing protein [Chitinophaga solisilvae]
MKNQDFTTTVLVDQTPLEVFNAIKNVRGWWSENIEGSTDTLNGQFVYNYKDIHLSKIQVTALVPAEKVEWLITDNYLKFTRDKSEWIGTRVIFNISRENGRTAVRFTHEGLVPQYECYEVCNEAWNHYIQDSLYHLITAGKGKPSPKDYGKSFDTALVEKWKLDN